MMRYNPSFWFVSNLLAIILLELFFPIAVNFSLAQPFGILFLSCAILIALWSKQVFSRHHTSYNPKDKPKYLITNNIYSLSRNPIYIALILAFIGISLILSLNYFPLGTVVLFTILTKVIIPYEEKELYEIFEDKYLQYKSLTPKWL